MADFGNTGPLLEHNDDDNDDEGGRNTTTPFKLDYNSTSGPSGEEIPMTTMNRGEERASETAKTSFIEGDTANSRVITSNKKAWDSLSRIYPEAKAWELEVSHGKTGRLQVKMFRRGKKTYPLHTEEKGKNKQRLNPLLPKQINTSLGPQREVLIAEKEIEIEEKQKCIQEDQGIVDEENKDRATSERATERITENQERINALENEREELEEGTSLTKRVRNIYEKYDLTVSAVVLAEINPTFITS